MRWTPSSGPRADREVGAVSPPTGDLRAVVTERDASFADPLTLERGAVPAFDRFYFELHGLQREVLVVLGGGVYPPVGISDAYVLAVIDDEQRNLRLSQHRDALRPGVVGAFRWETVAAHRHWRLGLGPNASGIELDVAWHARTPAFATRRYRIVDDHGSSDQAHLFQSGRYAGELRIDGRAIDVTGWVGQRDRSRGRRRVRDRLGLHLWIQAQFRDRSLGVLCNADRALRVIYCDGASMHEDGTIRPVVGVGHDLRFDAALRFHGGKIDVRYDDGAEERLDVAVTGPGIAMAGGGIGGWHGVDHGPRRIEHERWALGARPGPRGLPVSLMQTLARFDDGRESGEGIFEYALTRSSSFAYEARRSSP